MHLRRILWSCCVGLVGFLTGCGGEASVGVAPVSGKLTIDGKPLAKAIITFSPAEKGTAMPPSVGTTDTEGRFTLRTNSGQLGAVPGLHNVMVADESTGVGVELPDDRSLWKKAENPIPDKYRDPLKPALTFTVPPAGTEAANFDLQSK